MTETKSLDLPANEPTDRETERLRQGIEQTRAGMSATLEKLETRLSPDELRGRVGAELEHVEVKVREVVREHLAEAKTLVKEELAEAKTLLREEMNEAESKIKKGLVEARDTVKEDIRVAFTDAKRTVRAATLGKVEDFATNIGDAMNDTRDTLVDTIRQNPLPAAIAGLGIAWLFMNRSKSARAPAQSQQRGAASTFDAYGYESPAYGHSPNGRGRGMRDGARGSSAHGIDDVAAAVRGGVHRATETAGDLVHKASDAATGAYNQVSDSAGTALQGASELVGRVANQTADAASAFVHGAGDVSSQIVHRASEAASHAADEAWAQARRVERTLEQTLHENPLAVAAAALAVGAVVGFSLPRTHAEDQLMGETRDDVFKKAGSAAHEAVTAVGHLGEKAAETAKHLIGDGNANGNVKDASSSR